MPRKLSDDKTNPLITQFMKDLQAGVRAEGGNNYDVMWALLRALTVFISITAKPGNVINTGMAVCADLLDDIKRAAHSKDANHADQ